MEQACPPGSDRYVAGVGQWVRAQRRQQAGQARRKLGPDTSSLARRTVLSGFAQGCSSLRSQCPCPPLQVGTRRDVFETDWVSLSAHHLSDQ